MDTLTLPLVAVVAGLVSFGSPCCLPLVPGYLSYISALPVSQLGEREARAVTLRAALLFVAGFSTVFTLLGIGATLLGNVFLRNQGGIVRWFGVPMIVLGLATMGVIRLPLLMRERRIDLARVPRGTAWAFPMGMAFAAGWAPCIGPVLATILATAAVGGTVAWGALLLLLYSAGLGVPFVVLALGFHRAQRSLEWLRRNGRTIERVGGGLLVAVGVLFLSGRWEGLYRPLQTWAADPGASSAVGVVLAIAAVAVAVAVLLRPDQRSGDGSDGGHGHGVTAGGPVTTLRRTRRTLWTAVAVLVPVSILIVVLGTRPSASTRSVDSPLVGKRAPEAVASTVDGAQVSLADYRGKWVLVNFFATWCVPCRLEHPDLIRFDEQHRRLGDAAVVGVVYDDSVAGVREFRSEEGGEWPMLTDPKGRIALDFGVSGVPESFLVDPEGRIVSKIVGGVRFEDLERLLVEVKRRGGAPAS